MKPRPEIYRDILIIGGGQRGPGVAAVGGRWMEPNLGLSYLLAARHVIEAGERDGKLNEVALPAAYLQRHALEVAIKDVTNGAYVLKQSSDRPEALKTDPTAMGGDTKKSRFSHVLGELLDELRKALAAIKYEVPPRRHGDGGTTRRSGSRRTHAVAIPNSQEWGPEP